MDVTAPTPDRWQEFVDSDPLAVAYQSPDWYKAICSATRRDDISRLYTLADGRQLLLPLIGPRRLPAALASAASPPTGWGMGGILAPDGLTAGDIAEVVADVRTLGFARLSIRPNPLLGDVWAQAMPSDVHASPRFAHTVDLRPGFDHLWMKGFAHAVRKGVKKAERNGVEIECESGTRLLPVYQQLFEQSLTRWAEQQREPLRLAQYRANRRDPYSKLEAIATAMGDKCRTWVATVDGEPASALITIEDGNCIQGVKAAMNKDLAGPLHTNDLIYSRLIQQSCETGYDYYHLGESGNNPGLDAFKRRFGAVGYEYAEYFIERLPLSEADQKLRSLVKRVIGFKDF